MKKVKRKTRGIRGGATHQCPKCNGITRVRSTTRKDNVVMRYRYCTEKKCRHRYYTNEKTESAA